MKTKMIQLMAGALILASAPAAFAQDGEKEKAIKPYVAFGYNFAHGHAHDLTQQTWGGIGAFAAEAGFQFQHDAAPVQIRPNLGYAKILGDGQEGKKIYDLFGVYLGFDIVYRPFDILPVSITVGPSFHAWSVEEVNFPGDARQGTRATKLGWRFGAGYDVMKQLRVDLTYAMTEWRSTTSLPYSQGYNPSLPAYFTLKAVYSF